MTESQLLQIIADAHHREHEILEFKEWKGNIPFEHGTTKGSDELEKRKCVYGYCVGIGNMGGGKLLIGVKNDGTIVGTKASLPDDAKSWIYQKTKQHIQIDTVICPSYDDAKVIVIHIPSRPRGDYLRFHAGVPLMRMGDRLEIMDTQMQRAIITEGQEDRSAKVIPSLGLDVLDPLAITKAREEFTKKNPKHSSEEVASWDDAMFLNKAKLTIQGKITHAALILLGKEESVSYLSPATAQITWVLYDDAGTKIDYAHFFCPLLLNIEQLYHKIRNLNYRYIPDDTLFPIEVTKYDPRVLREGVNNAIAHQDYTLNQRIIIEEKTDELRITNAGSFIPGSIEKVIQDNAPEMHYRNKFLADAMVNLNMIDTIGSGIIKMFTRQKERFFPLPDYEFKDANTVKLIINGKIIDEKYTKLLMKHRDLSLHDCIALDKIQKGKVITLEQSKHLRKCSLIEGKYPKIYLSLQASQVTDQVSTYVKNKVDTIHYETMIIELIKNNKGQATRKQIDEVLIDKLPTNIYDTDKKKYKKIGNIIAAMREKETIKNVGNNKKSIRITN